MTIKGMRLYCFWVSIGRVEDTRARNHYDSPRKSNLLVGRSSSLLMYYIMLDPMSLKRYGSSTQYTCHVVVFRHPDSVEPRSTKDCVVIVPGIFAYRRGNTRLGGLNFGTFQRLMNILSGFLSVERLVWSIFVGLSVKVLSQRLVWRLRKWDCIVSEYR